MSLWDVSKNHPQRLSPQVYNDDVIPVEARMSHGTTQITLRDEADTTTVKLVFADGRVSVYDSSGTHRIAEGFLPDGEGGAIMSKEGESVEDAIS